MQRYNLVRPLLILAVAFVANNLGKSLSLLAGVSGETAGTIGFIVMMVAVILTFMKLNNDKNKRKPK